MQLRHRIVNLNSNPLRLNLLGNIDSRHTLSVQNIMTVGYAYLGNSNVTTTSYGHKLYPGQSFVIELAAFDNIWAVGDVGVQVAVFIQDRE